MTTRDLCSIRMRASSAARHASGAERLVPRERIDATVRELIERALARASDPDRVSVTIDLLGDAEILTASALDLISLTDRDHDACRALAGDLLRSVNVSAAAVATAVTALDAGASPAGGSMRGAMLIDAATGARLEPDRVRGVRVSRFDWSDEASAAITRCLAGLGLTHFRTREALALATKVARGPGVVAELCWSDDPDYTAGYVASPNIGYLRLPRMKEPGNPFGGRAFFVDPAVALDGLMNYLQLTPMLITSIGACRTADSPPLPGPTTPDHV